MAIKPCPNRNCTVDREALDKINITRSAPHYFDTAVLYTMEKLRENIQINLLENEDLAASSMADTLLVRKALSADIFGGSLMDTSFSVIKCHQTLAAQKRELDVNERKLIRKKASFLNIHLVLVMLIYGLVSFLGAMWDSTIQSIENKQPPYLPLNFQHKWEVTNRTSDYRSELGGFDKTEDIFIIKQ